MTISIISIYFIHHLEPICEELYKLLKDDFHFIATAPVSNALKNNGYPTYNNKPYLISAYKNEDEKVRAHRLIEESDVVILGNAPTSIKKQRVATGKLTFEYSERWFKRKYFTNILSPRLIKFWLFYILHLRHKPYYMLCASAYLYNDLSILHIFRNRCFKWGYFTAVPQYDIKQIITDRRNQNKIRIIWCARFLSWKHPELLIRMATILKDLGYNFEINMYGNGALQKSIQRQINKLNLGDIVYLKGNIANNEIIQQMCKSHIFIFTSDQHEGWGAVLNEAMSCGCAVISSNAIGATPYLVQHAKNGYIFRSGDVKQLVHYCKKLIDDQTIRETMSYNAYKTISEIWSPKNAAIQFIQTAKYLKGESFSLPTTGPASIANKL